MNQYQSFHPIISFNPNILLSFHSSINIQIDGLLPSCSDVSSAAVIAIFFASSSISCFTSGKVLDKPMHIE